MLAPEYLAGLADELVELYSVAENDILVNMAERIAKYDYYIPAVQHQHQRLRAMRMLESEIEERLSALTGKSEEELRRLMEEAVKQSLTADAAVYAAAGMGPVDVLAAAGVRQVLRSGLAQTGGLFENLTRTTAHTATKQFEDALDRAWLQITSGGFDYHTAIRNTIKDLARQGVGSITYPSGHKDTLEVAVRRAVVTGCNQTAAKAQIALMDELGTDLVETSAHRGARPSHAEWQGQIFSRSGRSEKYPDFVSSTGYGTGAGLCGWNCSHSFGPYIEGAPRAYSPAMLEQYSAETVTYNGKTMTEYEAGQQQRYIERQIRRWKRECAAMDAAGLDTSEAAAKLSAWREKEKDFCRQTGLKRQGDRSQVAGFGRSEAAKAVAKQKKHGILKDTGFAAVPVTDGAIQRVPLVSPAGWSKQQAEQLQEAHRELLMAVKDKPVGTEAGRIYGLDMSPISPLIVGKNAEQQISLPRSHEPHVIVHSHPSGQTFSPGDIDGFGMRGEASIITVVGNNGSVYILQKTEQYNAVGFSLSLRNDLMSKLSEDLTAQEYLDIVNEFLKGAEKYGIRSISG